MDADENISLRLVGNIAASLKLFNVGGLFLLRRHLHIGGTGHNDLRPCRLKYLLCFHGNAESYALLCDTGRSDGTRVTAAVSRVNGNYLPLKAGELFLLGGGTLIRLSFVVFIIIVRLRLRLRLGR